MADSSKMPQNPLKMPQCWGPEVHHTAHSDLTPLYTHAQTGVTRGTRICQKQDGAMLSTRAPSLDAQPRDPSPAQRVQQQGTAGDWAAPGVLQCLEEAAIWPFVESKGIDRARAQGFLQDPLYITKKIKPRTK